MVLVAIGLAFLLDDLGATDDEAVLVPLVVIGVGIGLMLSAMPSRGGPAPEQASVALAGAVGAPVRVNHGAGRLRVGSRVGGGTLLEGSFAGGVDVRERRDGDRLEVDLSANPFR